MVQDEERKDRRKSCSKDLRNDFVKKVQKADGTII